MLSGLSEQIKASPHLGHQAVSFMCSDKEFSLIHLNKNSKGLIFLPSFVLQYIYQLPFSKLQPLTYRKPLTLTDY